MKEYFNKSNRENHMLMLLLWEKLDIWQSKTKQLSKEELKHIRTARTLLLKTNNSITKRLGAEYYYKLERDIKNTSFEIITTFTANSKKASVKVMAADIELLGRYALDSCQSNNNNCDCYWQKCEVYQTLYRLNVETLHTNCDYCPYKQIESEKMK